MANLTLTSDEIQLISIQKKVQRLDKAKRKNNLQIA